MEPLLMEAILNGPVVVCDFITPGVAAVISAVASTASTIATSETQKAAAKKASSKQIAASEAAADDLARRDQLLTDRSSRLRQRRAAGSGQNTILGGAAPQAEIGRNVLLGQ